MTIMNAKYCHECGKEISEYALACPHCGALQKTNSDSPKSRAVAIVLALFLGWFGIHKFYMGQPGQGILMLVLLMFGIGFFVNPIWCIIDIIVYATSNDGRFR